MAPIEALEATTTREGPTGPRTATGKSIASRNATKNGLFSAHDLVRENEAAEYAETSAALHAQLGPEGCLEETFTTEIMTATWRLRRCRLIEADLDPIMDDLNSQEQKSVDRARAQAHHILRQSLAELRKLQTERTIRIQLGAEDFPAFTDLKQVTVALKLDDRQRLLARKADGLDSLEGLIAHADKQLCQEFRESKTENHQPPASSFCKPAPITPRSAPCPCNSGIKYKRCCGKNAPPVLSLAA